MHVSQRLIDYIKSPEIEGYRNTSYRDQAGVWTIGYGTTMVNGKPVTSNMCCTPQEAELWLLNELKEVEDCVHKAIKIELEQNQFDALVMLTYNIGCFGFRNSTLVKEINAKHPVYMDLFTRWKYVTINGKKVVSNGLLLRRMKEWKIYNKEMEWT